MSAHDQGTSEHMVYLVDDDEADLETASRLLTSAGYKVKAFTSGGAFLEHIDVAGDCSVVLDMRLPGVDGLAVLRELSRRGSSLPVVAVTGQAEIALAVEAMRAGALEFIEKSNLSEALLPAVENAVQLARKRQTKEAARLEARQKLALLSPREREVLDALVAGLQNKMDAYELGLSVRTVEVHRGHMMEKLGARSIADAVRIYLSSEG